MVEPTAPNGTVVRRFKGRAEHVGSGTNNGTVSLSGTVEFSGAFDLSAATLTLSQLLHEQKGIGELAQGANGSAFLPLTLLPVPHGRKDTQAIFKTPAGVEPRVRVEVKQRDSRKGNKPDEWEFTLTAERMLIDAAAGCNGAPHTSTKVATQLAFDDGTHVPVVIHTTQSWRCGKHTLKAS